MNTFWPLRRNPPLPSGLARVVISIEFEPAFGSVMAKQNLMSPAQPPGSRRRFMSSLACLAISPIVMVGPTTRLSSGMPLFASPSMNSSISVMPWPAPPYASGTMTPRKPSSVICRYSSAGGSLFSA